MQYDIGQSIDIEITRYESNQDRAFDEAYTRALQTFGSDLIEVNDGSRTKHRIGIKFISHIAHDYTSRHALALSHTYKFKAWVERQDNR